ncbi:MAG: N-6 DNA methylase [Candidatus Marinimicrobia bacterium]|nr:N-6 DNA methylase [Candidatus Neomarinimicrobiota bacterium]
MIPTWKFCKDLWGRRYIGLAKGNEALTCQELIEPILKQFGFAFLPKTRLPVGKQQQEPDYILFADEKTKNSVFEKGKLEQYETAISLVEVKKVNHPLSAVSKTETPGRFPHQQLRDYLQSATDDTGKPFFNWAILTNGNRWRLYCRNAHPGDYFEFNFEDSILSLNDFTTFYALFRPAAFVKNGDGRCALDDLREESLQVQTKLEDDLRKRIFNILTDLANGFYKRKENNINENDLVVLYDNCLIFLYRLLFVLYAEGRGLLPVKSRGVGSNKHYRNRYSIAALIPKLKSRLNYDSDDFTDLYNRLLGLFHLINGDQPSRNKACQVPQYNGGLFDHKQHTLIEKWQVGERTLSDVLRGLIFSNIPVAPGETLKFDFGETIDYADLEVRQLGSIYEGLLENRLELEGNHLVLVGDRSDRKATGTYYTPDYIVKYIVEKTLQPLCEKTEKLTNVQKAKGKGAEDNSFANEIMKLNVLDPAMGSGHFLVRVTEFLADQIVYHPTTELQIEDVPRGLSHEEAEISYWRRRVVESCIYGVDLNPLAVELAKLSLWLTCIAVKQPLSFLDHHLRPGNSLIGANLSELGRLPDKKKNNQIAFSFGPDLTEAVSDSIMALTEIEQMETVDVLTVKDKEMLWKKKVHDRLKPYRTVADLWTSTFFGLEISDFDYQHLAKQLAKNPKPRTKEGKELKKELSSYLEYLTIAKAKRPFHWELEFPEVFFSEDGSSRKNAGFDAVIGNPPYIRIQTSGRHEIDYYNTFYTSAVGNYDVYCIFVEKGLKLFNSTGKLGFILPHRFFKTNYGKGLRKLIFNRKNIERIINFDGFMVFKNSNINTCIMILDGHKNDRFLYGQAKFIKNSQSIVSDILREIGDIGDSNSKIMSGIISSSLITTSPWIFIWPWENSIWRKLEAIPVRLSDISERIFQGLKTGSDKIYIVEIIEKINRDFVVRSYLNGKSYKIEKNLLKPLIKGGQMKRYSIIKPDKCIIFPYENGKQIPINQLRQDFPKTIEYLLNHKSYLEKRESGKMKGEHWYEYTRNQALDIMWQPKIITPDYYAGASYSLDPNGEFYFCGGGAGGYGIIVKKEYNIRYLLGLLNSQLLDWYLKKISIRAYQTAYMYTKKYIERLPIYTMDFHNPSDKSRHDKLVELVDRMLDLHKKLPNVEMADEREAIELEIKSTDRQIDQVVYDLYDLNEEEIKIVEGNN